MTAKLQAILTEFKADSGTVHLMEGDGQLHLAAAIGIPDPVLRIVQVIPIGKGMAGLAAERRAPVTACNIQTDNTGDVRPGARATGLEGAIALPMLRDGRVAGVLGVANHRERTFTAAEVDRLLELASHLAG
ncbi:MAG: GAF domain-containing protein [Bryobacteraceae bacterium]